MSHFSEYQVIQAKDMKEKESKTNQVGKDTVVSVVTGLCYSTG